MGTRAALLLLFLVAFARSTPAAPPSAAALESAIAERMERVEEFRFIRQEAERLGVRVWLFGGTAAGFGHYVRWDLERETGDARHHPGRFDYDYTNIYRSTQDLDIVVEGDPAKATELERALHEHYPYFLGNKSTWEVRMLRASRGDKEAILENPNFSLQHTDSNSTGLIEVTRPPRGEAVVRDSRDWDSATPYFLEDVRRGELHYYFSPQHGKTARYKQGLNPPIFSVIRYLTKAFQYELAISPEDWARLVQVVSEFKPSRDLKSAYAKDWMEKNGQKLFLHSTNVEYAWDTLQKLGLRQKLAGAGDRNQAGSLAWWMSKEPLRSSDVGRGWLGRTAKDLGIDTVAHETKDFAAYEVMTRSSKNEPNVFISRSGKSGEAAAFGDGFYTAQGKFGMRGTGFTLRFQVDPNAREGKDFKLVGSGIVLVLNRRAITLIPESLDVSPLEFFELMAKLPDSERGLIEKLKRRVGRRFSQVSEEEQTKVIALLEQSFENPGQKGEKLWQIWFSTDASHRHPELARRFLKAHPSIALRAFLGTSWPRQMELSVQELGEFLGNVHNYHSTHLYQFLDELVPGMEKRFASLSNEEKQKAVDFVKVQSFGRVTCPAGWIWETWFKMKSSTGYPELADTVLGHSPSLAVHYFMKHEHWKNVPFASDAVGREVVAHLRSTDLKDANVLMLEYLAEHPEHAASPRAEQWVARLAGIEYTSGRALARVLALPAWDAKPQAGEWASELAARKMPAGALLNLPAWRRQPQFGAWLEGLPKKMSGLDNRRLSAFVDALAAPEWRNAAGKKLLGAIIDANPTDWHNPPKGEPKNAAIARLILSREDWANDPDGADLLMLLYKKSHQAAADQISAEIFSKPHWIRHPRLIEIAEEHAYWFSDKKGIRFPFLGVLMAPGWESHPQGLELLELQLRHGSRSDAELSELAKLMTRPEWWSRIAPLVPRPDRLRASLDAAAANPKRAGRITELFDGGFSFRAEKLKAELAGGLDPATYLDRMKRELRDLTYPPSVKGKFIVDTKAQFLAASPTAEQREELRLLEKRDVHRPTGWETCVGLIKWMTGR